MSALHNSFLSSETPIRVPNGDTSIGRSRRADSRSSTTTRPGPAPLSRAARRDWKLVQQAVAGDSRAREELFTIHTARLYRTAFSVLRNKEDAQDAVQNSLCSAFLNLGSFKGQSLFSTWLTRIVINSALMIRRSRTGHVETSLDEMIDSQPERLRHRIVHSAPNPEEAYAASETNELVSEQIRKLPPTLSRPASTLLRKRVVRRRHVPSFGHWPQGPEGSDFSSAAQIGVRGAIHDGHRSNQKKIE
jgi:RNA polymerase sigma-70 factor (ECF subfamily)